MPKPKEVGALVEATGLVNAKDLNGKVGTIIKKKNEAGRVAVLFRGIDKPKLIKESNLREFSPYSYITRNGTVARIRTENGKGKTCVDCHCDLDGKDYLYESGEYRCEEDYVNTFTEEGYKGLCVQCHMFLGKRELTVAPREPFDAVYPNGRLPDGRQIKDTTNNAFYAHGKCLDCMLCGCTMEKAEHGMQFGMNNTADTFPLEITCNGPPGSTGWCSNELGPYKEASKRLTELQNMKLEEIQNILQERQVPYKSNESKDSMICKIIVTDKKKGDKVSNVVTHTDASGKEHHYEVKSREAPGAVLRNRRCKHGAKQWAYDDTPAQRRKRKLINEFINTYMRAGDNFNLFAECLVKNKEVVVDDVEERFMPGALWSMAVGTVIHEEGALTYAAMNIFASLFIDGVLDMIESSSSNDFTTRDCFGVLMSLQRKGIMDKMNDQDKLFLFMHQYEKRHCDCMKYVVAAIEVGSLRKGKEMKIKRNVETCAYCDEALVRPRICSGCKMVAYCHEMHQREHWKVHKKDCNGRKKKA